MRNFKDTENEQTRGRLRYLERLAEEEEANKAIKEFEKEEEQDDDFQNTIRRDDISPKIRAGA